MTLVDNETGENIINPYITIFDYPKRNSWVALNTSTFGSEGQKNLLNIIDEKHFMEKTPWRNNKWYKVCATIGKQDHPYDWESNIPFTRGVRVEGANDAIAIVPLGYLKEDYIQKNFPRSFAYFENCKKKAAGENVPDQGPRIEMSIYKLPKT